MTLYCSNNTYNYTNNNNNHTESPSIWTLCPTAVLCSSRWVGLLFVATSKTKHTAYIALTRQCTNFGQLVGHNNQTDPTCRANTSERMWFWRSSIATLSKFCNDGSIAQSDYSSGTGRRRLAGTGAELLSPASQSATVPSSCCVGTWKREERPSSQSPILRVVCSFVACWTERATTKWWWWWWWWQCFCVRTRGSTVALDK